MHPAAWVVWATCAGMVAFSTTNPLYLATIAAVSWFVYAAHHVQGPSARSFRIFFLVALVTVAVRTALVFLGTVNASNVTFAALEGMRLGVLLIVFGTFNAVTDPFGVLRLAPRRFHEPALAARGLGREGLVAGVEVVDDAELVRLLSECDAVLTY